MPKNGAAFSQKPIRTLSLFALLVLLMVIFLVSIYDTIKAPRHLPSHTSTTHDRSLRGKIISADGYTLSRSSKTYKATIFKQSINPNKKELIIKLFSIYSKVDEKKLRKIIKEHKGYMVLADKIDANTAISLKALAYKLRSLGAFKTTINSHGSRVLYGLDIIENGEVRFYPLKDTLSPVLGYTTKKDDGKYIEVEGQKGIEKHYEEYLRSDHNGITKGMRDISGTIIHNKSLLLKDRKDGMDVHLNIYLSLQRRVELMLKEMQELTNAKEIIAGVMESKTGKVIALASSMQYDPEHIQDKDVYSLNPKFSEFLYEPGSVMKPITLSIALEHGKVTPQSWFDTKGGRLKISSKYTITDDHSFDSLTATDIIVHSSNVGITKIGWRLDENQFYNGFHKFGFGLSSGIDLSRDLSGKVRSAKELANKVNRASQSYGYGMTATFAQIWKAYSAFDNNGIAVTPKITKYLKYDKNQKKYQGKTTMGNLRPINKDTANKIKKILKKVVREGTGKAAQYSGLEIGGKTGTSHIVEHRRYINKYNSSFFGFVNDTKGNKYTIGVLSMHLTKGHMHYASQSSVPVFKKIVTQMVELGFLYPDMSVIQKQKMQEEKQKRERASRQKQAARAKELKARLKKERVEIRQRQRVKKSAKSAKNRSHYKKPTIIKHNIDRSNNIPDMF